MTLLQKHCFDYVCDQHAYHVVNLIHRTPEQKQTQHCVQTQFAISSLNKILTKHQWRCVGLKSSGSAKIYNRTGRRNKYYCNPIPLASIEFKISMKLSIFIFATLQNRQILKINSRCFNVGNTLDETNPYISSVPPPKGYKHQKWLESNKWIFKYSI